MDTRDTLLFQVTSGLPQAVRRWQRLVAHSLDGCGLSGASAIPLIVIGRAGEGLHQVELAEEVGVMASALVRQLDRLCMAGLVRREADPNNRRANMLWLTEKGRHQASLLESQLAALRRQVMEDMDDAELEAVVRLQGILAGAVEQLDEFGDQNDIGEDGRDAPR